MRYMRSRGSFLGWATAFALFAAVRVAAVAGRRVGIFNDTLGYLRLSFVGHGRPWVVPLLYTATTSSGARVAAQCAVSIVCFCLLAFVAARMVRRAWLQVVVAGGVLLIGASPQVTRWDLALVSESLALSLSVAVIATWLLFATRTTRARMIAVWGVTLLWAFTRSAHLVLLPLIVVLLVVSLAWVSGRRSRGLLMLALVPVAIWGLVAVRNDPGATEYNIYTVIELRVFGHIERTRYFVEHDMPVSADIERFRSFVPRELVPPHLVQDARVPIGLNVPDLVVTGRRPFIRWMQDEGPSTYLKWLASHPGYTVAEPLRNLHELVAPKLARITPPLDARAVMPTILRKVLFESPVLYLLSISAALLSAIAAVLLKLMSRPLAVAWCVVGMSIALLYVAWLGAAIEIERHAIVASVASRIGILMVLAFTVDLLRPARLDLASEDRAGDLTH
jgi:hypothetical protein